MLPAPKPYLTSEDYLAIERSAEGKSEYLDGEMFAMAGASEAHNLIVSNLIRSLGNRLAERPCRVYPGDLRVLVEATGLYTYPDVSVVCGEPRLVEDRHQDNLTNPQLLIEVLSPSTEAFDRGRKFEHYRAIPSLREYLLVAQEKSALELFLREGDGFWRFTAVQGIDSVLTLPTLGIELPLGEVYGKVTFPA